MPRKANLGCPDWVISIVLAWARRERSVALGGLGFYRINPMLRDGIPVQARSFEPTGYSNVDLEQVEQALGKLERVQALAVIRYVLPERIKAIGDQVSLSDTTWLQLLKVGLCRMTSLLEGKRAA